MPELMIALAMMYRQPLPRVRLLQSLLMCDLLAPEDRVNGRWEQLRSHRWGLPRHSNEKKIPNLA